MIYIKVENGVDLQYPYSFNDLRMDNLGTLFPAQPSSECLIEYNAYIVQEATQPIFDRMTQKAKDTAIYENNNWVQQWELENLPLEIAEQNIRLNRNNLLEETDWMALSDNIMTDDWSNYRQALRDITDQAGFPYNIVWPIKPT